MEQIRVSSWSELHEQLYAGSWNEELGLHRSDYAFRGRPLASEDLTTSLARIGGDTRGIERPLLRHFRKYAARDAVPVDSTWNWLALAQHHGLPTRLLDWTYSPYVALHLEREGANVFTTEMIAAVAADFGELDKLGDDFVVFVEPPSFDERIVNQYALFSLSDVSLNRWLEEHPELTRKLVVPAELKWEIRDKLDQANITERVLFPGLDGLSRWLTRYYAPRR